MLEMLRDELSETGSKINLVKCNLSNPNEIDNSINESIKKYGCPSVLINNAGCAFNGNLVEMPLTKWQEIIPVSYTHLTLPTKRIV